MKNFAVAVVLAASAVQGYLIPPKTNKIDWRYEQKRQIVGTVTSLLGKGGKVADPAGAAPKRQNMQTDSVLPGVKRIKMRYGPYSVPNMNKTSVTGEHGMLWNYPDTAIPKPCNECNIVKQFAGLEYPDGKNANINTGLWLHHMVHMNIGPGRSDATCMNSRSLPHVDVGSSPTRSERYFSSGNERTQLKLDIKGMATKWTYHLKSTDKFAFIVDLMNMNMEDKTVYMTMTYDIIEGPIPAGWADVRVVWFDVNQCGTSEVRPPKQTGQFTISAKAWKPNFEGMILGVGGHMHDGGVNLEVHYNTGKMFCDTKATYGGDPNYVSMEMAQPGHMAGYAKNHISKISDCYLDDLPVKRLSADQSWTIHGKYDYDKYQGNKEDGKQSEIMAIALMYVALTK